MKSLDGVIFFFSSCLASGGGRGIGGGLVRRFVLHAGRGLNAHFSLTVFCCFASLCGEIGPRTSLNELRAKFNAEFMVIPFGRPFAERRKALEVFSASCEKWSLHVFPGDLPQECQSRHGFQLVRRAGCVKPNMAR